MLIPVNVERLFELASRTASIPGRWLEANDFLRRLRAGVVQRGILRRVTPTMLLFFWRPSQSVDFAAVLFESTVVFYTNSPKHRMCSELCAHFFLPVPILQFG